MFFSYLSKNPLEKPWVVLHQIQPTNQGELIKALQPTARVELPQFLAALEELEDFFESGDLKKGVSFSTETFRTSLDFHDTYLVYLVPESQPCFEMVLCSFMISNLYKRDGCFHHQRSTKKTAHFRVPGVGNMSLIII